MRPAGNKNGTSALTPVLEAMQDLKRLERSDPTDIDLIAKYKVSLVPPLITTLLSLIRSVSCRKRGLHFPHAS